MMTDTQFDLLFGEIKGIKTILTGNGDPQKGMIVRLDRVEVKLRRADWLAKAIFGALAAGVCALLADLIVNAVR